ncbi:MAG: PGN_0703 family putative restriction endonuclease [Thermoleophilia bacterium]
MESVPNVTEDELGPYDRLEPVDLVRNDPETTAFKRRARLHQSQWRERHKLEPGMQPARPTAEIPGRLIGSRIAIDMARESGANFISDAARNAADDRIAKPEPHQTFDADRLYGDLLSSMPMCFNLFGPLHADLELADKAIKTWWQDAPGKVSSVRFEWSPGRSVAGEYVGNRSAFDVAFELDLGAGKFGVIGVETKYHEDCKTEAAPYGKKRLPRYAEVTSKSDVFVPAALDKILGTRLQQIWLDHLLALSMVQHPSGQWEWAKFVLVHPRLNPSYARVAEEYQTLLADDSTFDVTTVEALLEARVLPKDTIRAFTERYLW